MKILSVEYEVGDLIELNLEGGLFKIVRLITIIMNTYIAIKVEMNTS